MGTADTKWGWVFHRGGRAWGSWVPALITLLWVCCAQAATRGDLRFDRLTILDGLSQNAIYWIVQDPRGFLWLATHDGLNRYDGYQFKIYRSDPGNPTALGHNHVNTLAMDPEGHLWVGHRQGLQRFDPVADRFLWIDEVYPGAPALNAEVTALAIGDSGELWVGTIRGDLFRVDRDTGHQLRIESSLSNLGRIYSMTADGPGRVWLSATDRLAMVVVDQDGYAIRDVAGLGSDRLVPEVRHLMVDRDGDYWVSAANGLVRFRLAEQAGEYLAESVETMLEGSLMQMAFQDSTGAIWAAGLQGLQSRWPGVEDWERHHSDAMDPYSIGSDDVMFPFEDATGVMWFGTAGGGLARFARNSAHFRHISAATEAGRGLNSRLVFAILEDRQGDLWVGTKGGGLNRYRQDIGQFQYYRHDPGESGSLSHDFPVSLFEDREGRLWVGTWGGGINRYQPETDDFALYSAIGDDHSVHDRVLSMDQSEDGKLWLATNHGVNEFDPETGISRVFLQHLSRQGAVGGIRSVLVASDGRVWAGSERNGLSWIDPESGDVERFGSGLDAARVTGIIEQVDAGRLWLSTDLGLALVDTETGQTRIFRRADGLPNELLYGLVLAGPDELWMSTNAGIARFSIADQRFEAFDMANGLTSNEFNTRAHFRARDGTLMFGSVQGITVFQPGQIQPDPTAPRAVVTDLRLFNRSVPLGAITQGQRLMLDHTDTMISFDFSAPHYASPERNQFAYRLVGLGSDWIQTDASRRSATFTGLAPGDYRLQLKASNGDGVWQQVPTELHFSVAPPPWRTPWAYLAYITGALMLLAIIAILRLRKIRERERAQAILAESEDRLRMALWGSGDELWDWNIRAGSVRRMNTLETLQRPDRQRVRSIDDVARFVHPDDFPRLKQALHSHLDGDAPSYDAAYRCRNAEGGWTWVLERGQVVARDSEGRPARLSGTTKDIDTLKATEQALKELNDVLEQRVDERTRMLQDAYEDLRATQKQLVQSEKMASLGNLVAGVAHELNTPIGIGVTAASHLKDQLDRTLGNIQEDELDPEMTQALEKSRESVALVLSSLDRTAEMVRSFKQVAVDQGTEEKRQFDLAAYLDQIMTSLRPKLRKAGHELDIVCPPGLNLLSQPGMFYQIVTNLVLNSIRHGYPDGVTGTLTLQAGIEAQRDLLLIYRDDGRGMDAATRKRVFEPFFTTARSQGGTGLGLHIVFNLVTQALGGQIECESEPGRGVCFTLRIPEVICPVDDEAMARA